MYKRGLVVIALAAALAAAASHCSAAEWRAFWVDTWHPGFKTSAQVDQMLADVRACNGNAVFVQVRRRGDTYYPSPYEPWASDADPSFDALAYTIQRAHSGSPRIEVFAWFVMYPVASSVPGNPNHPYNRYPQYLMKDDAGSTYTGDDYFFDPGHPGAEQYLHDVVLDVVNRYDVDGIQFDYIRYPGYHWGYNDTSVARFNAIYGRTGQPLYTDSQWCDWRRAQVTSLVRKIYANTVAAKPNVKVSAATVTWTPAADNDAEWPTVARAYKQVYQDWRSWMQEGILDLNVPMNYYDCQDTDTNWQDFYTWLCFAAEHQYSRHAIVGLGSCGKSDECFSEQMQASRQPCAGGQTNKGWGIYSYACMTPSLYDETRALCPTWTAPPAMSWKTSPTKGHVRGNVTYGAYTQLDNATVELLSGTTLVSTMRTDGTGFFAFIDVSPGIYSVRVTKTGYGQLTVPAAVVAGQVATANADFPVASLTISNIQVSAETANSVTVTWTTNAASTSQVAYGLDNTCSSLTTENTSYVTAHSMVVSGLQPLTPYFYRVISRNPTTQVAMSSVYVFVSGPYAPDIIIDNPSAALVGSWVDASSSTDKYGSNYRYCSTATPDVRSATFTPTMPVAGSYAVSVWYPQGGNRSTAAPYTINYNGGSQTYTVNQQVNGGVWNLLGTKTFALGTAGNVRLTNQAPGGALVMADAVRFQCQLESTAPSTPQNLQLQVMAHDRIDMAWTASSDNAAVAGYRVYRDGMVVAASATNSFSDTGLLGNKNYTYYVQSYDTSGNKSGSSTSRSTRTLSVPPSPATITCSRPAGIWQTSNPFVFTAVGGFGPGKVSYYSYAWDTSPTHTWDGSEWSWVTGVKSITADSSANPYYLHVLGYNDDGITNGSADFGPYYIDTTPPGAPTIVATNDYSASPTQIEANWAANDSESGICSYQYAVGTSAGATNLVGWTETPSTSQTIVVPEQPVGTVLYVTVKARNCAGTWGAENSGSGVTIGVPVATVAEAKSLEDGSAIILTDKLVTALFGDSFYVQDDTRVSGIRVNLTSAFVEGNRVIVRGVLTTVNGERVIASATAELAP